MTVEIDPQWRRRQKAPIGIYIVGAIVFLRLGVFEVIGFYTAVREANGDVYIPVVVISFALSVFASAAAVWAMTGDNAGPRRLDDLGSAEHCLAGFDRD